MLLTRRRFLLVISGLILLAVMSLALAIGIGSINILAIDELSTLTLWNDIVWKLRFPRALAVFAVGGLLALAGSLWQILLRNPLADPYILGISGGAGVGTLLVMLFGWGMSSALGLDSNWNIGLGAVLGAIAAMIVVFSLAQPHRYDDANRLLLTGVAISSLSMAIEAAILALSSEKILRGMVFWLLGDFTGAPWEPALIAWLLALGSASLIAPAFNVLLIGTQQATVRGVSRKRIETIGHIIAALATAVAVMTAGTIGFVGLLVPHFLRLWLGNDQRLLLPAAAFSGGIFLVFMDTLSRWLWAPQQLPIGVLTALIGVPAFLWILHSSKFR